MTCSKMFMVLSVVVEAGAVARYSLMLGLPIKWASASFSDVQLARRYRHMSYLCHTHAEARKRRVRSRMRRRIDGQTYLASAGRRSSSLLS